MAARQSGIVLGQIHTLFNEGRIGHLTDAQLLERFAVQRAQAAEASEAAEAAFEAVVLRHGPMVLAVCRRILRDPHDVEDAFQATFLILARRAESIRKREVLGGWLRKVAHRVAVRTRALSARRVPLDADHLASAADEPRTIVEREDLRTAVLDEVQLLPEKYRLPVQFCYIEGQTHDEAARRLAWPVGTVRTRLAWARERMRIRLTRRGLALQAGFIGASMVSLKARAEVTPALVKATVETAIGRAAATAITSLTTEVLKGMLMSQLKLAILAIVVTGSLVGLVLPLVGAPMRNAEYVARAGNNRPSDQQAERQNDPQGPRDVGTVFLRVVDRATKQPIRGVNLKVLINGNVTREHTTDDSGRFEIRLPTDNSESVTITAQRDGLVPIRVYLRGITARETEIPRSHTLAMEPGTSIGGIVRDEAGEPIEGVNVNLYENNQDDGARQVYDFRAITARSDQQGRWQIDLIPAGFDLGRLHFTFSHPEFLSSIDAVNNQPIATPKELRDKSAALVLHRGIVVNGRVLDRGGRPIAGATVRLDERLPGSKDVVTDTFGRFHIGNALPRETVLTAQATGYAPEMQPLKVQPGLTPVELRLGPGNTIRGRVVDREGHPIKGAIVGPLRWREHQTLEWRAETDALGRFRWDDAPSDAVSMSANKRGYSHSSVEITPSTKECVLTLSRALLIRGSVTDAQTGRPIGTFTVVPSVQMNGNMTVWMPGFAKIYHGGRYEIPLDSLGTQPHRVRIEAEDYRAAVSPIYASDAGEQVFDARLEKGEWIKGVVRGRDGRLVTGAEVIIAAFPGIHISGGKTYQRDFHPHMLTGADGRFGFAPIDGPFRVIALHDMGYTESSGPQLAQSHEIKLEPWGRIEGTLRVGGKPLAHETVVASLDEERIDPPWFKLQNESRAQTDEHGRFVIERIVPGEASVYWQPNGNVERKTSDRYYQPAFRTVGPGQTVHADLIQEGGRPLVGKIVASDRPEVQLDLAGSDAFLLPRAPKVPYPPDLSEEERREWLSRWRLTEEGRDYRHARRGFAHGLEPKQDGTFRVDEVQPGAYELHIHIKGFVELVRDFDVAEPPPGQHGTPVDLGTLALKRL